MKNNTFPYEIGRWAVLIVAVISLMIQFGGNAQSQADAREVADAVTACMDMENMLEADNQLVKRFYGLDPSAFESCILYYPNTNMMAEEVLIVKLSDMSQQEQVRKACLQRLDTQKTTFEGYGVEQYEMLENKSIIDVRGNFVLFVVNPNASQAQRAFRNAL